MMNVQNNTLSSMGNYSLSAVAKNQLNGQVLKSNSELKASEKPVVVELSKEAVEKASTLASVETTEKLSFFSKVKNAVVKAKDTVQNVVSTAVTLGKNVVDKATQIGNIVSDKASKIYDKVSNAVTTISSAFSSAMANSEKLKEASQNMVNAATSLVSTGVKTSVSIGADVALTAGVVAKSASKIAEGYNSGLGFVDKAVKIFDGFKTLAEAKDPVLRIPQTFKTGLTDMKGHYGDLKTNFEVAKTESTALKEAIVTIGKEIKSTATYVKNELTEGVTAISDLFGSSASKLVMA